MLAPQSVYEAYIAAHGGVSRGELPIGKARALYEHCLLALGMDVAIVGITHSALKVYADSDFGARTGGLERAHKVSRSDHSAYLLTLPAPASNQKFSRLMVEAPAIICSSKQENFQIEYGTLGYLHVEPEWFSHSRTTFRLTREGIIGLRELAEEFI
jgi:hypothetical protein